MGRKLFFGESMRYKMRAKRNRETPEQRETRLAQVRASQKRYLDRETVLQREERLAKGRWSRALKQKGESFESRERRLEDSRMKSALQRSQKKEELERVNRLLQTESAFETGLMKQIRDQLHQRPQKVVRLSVSNVKHINIVPYTRDIKDLGETSFPMEYGLSYETQTQIEAEVVVSEPDHPPMPVMSVQIKPEPTDYEADNEEMITGDIGSMPIMITEDSKPKPESIPATILQNSNLPITLNTEIIPSDNTPEPDLITGDIKPNFGQITQDSKPQTEPSMHEADIGLNSQAMNRGTSAIAGIKSEIYIKPEMCTEEL